MMKTLMAALLISATVSAGAAERVRNGHFEEGRSGYTTDMTYQAPTGAVPPTSNTYTIGKSPIVGEPAYGHDDGMDDYMIGSGATTRSGIVWRQTGIPVTPGREYLFDSWFAALHDSNRPEFEVFINYNDGRGGRYLGTWRATRPVGVWQGMEARFTPTTRTVTISMRNLTGANVGNNFALDAVRVVTPCEWRAERPGGQPCRE